MNNSGASTRFEEFYRHEVQAVYRFVYSRVGNHEDALEIVQESFLALYQLQQNNEAGEHERALLFRLARNRAIDLLRRRRTRETFGQEAATGKVLLFRAAETRTPPMPPTPEDILLDKERRHWATMALAQLSERDQECLALRCSGLSYREVAEALRLNPNSVGQIINRALRRFAESYEALQGKKQNDEKTGKTGRE
ncbi:MAG: RNA polymerase sigma factor [Blastocatellia bacterium]